MIHLAAESHVDRSITASRSFIETNILDTYTLLETARRYWSSLSNEVKEDFRFLHVSTDEVYGSLGVDGFFTELTRYDPSSPYSASKASSDHLAVAWHRTYRLPVIVSNCSNNYGPYHFPEKLIPLVILNALEGKPLPVYGKGANVRDWLYVEDHARALHLILTRGRPGETYNVGGRNERTNLEVVQTICRILDEIRSDKKPHDRLITFVRDRPGHDLRYAIDATKLENEVGWKAKETFASEIRKTVFWYLENEWWWGPLLALVRNREVRGEVLAPAEIRVVADQYGCPTYGDDIAVAVVVIARNLLDRPQDKHLRGVFHLACTGETNGRSKFGVKPITTAEYPTPARRPANSRLDCSKLARLHGIQLPSWRASLKHCLSRLMTTSETEKVPQNEKGCK